MHTTLIGKQQIKATRQRVTTTDKKTVLGESDDKITLADHGLGTESVDVLLKDLGPQMCTSQLGLPEPTEL